VKPIPTVSVIIPTYNRKDVLHETLKSLAQQTYPTDGLEVIVVDDGSTDGTDKIAGEAMPFALRYFRQSNQGDAAARNHGARQSQADVLVFLDDDMSLAPNYLTCVVHAHNKYPNRIMVGTWDLWQAEASVLSQSLNSSLPTGAFYARPEHRQSLSQSSDQSNLLPELPFRDVYSNNMSLRRQAYFDIGMMPSLEFSGSSMWCDLEFAYLAYQKGFEFCRSAEVICWHRDHSVSNLNTYSQRMRTAAYRVVPLFRKYPELVAHLPMFFDKTPIVWGQDPLRLISRKLARSLASSHPALWGLEQIANFLEKRSPWSRLLPSLYRYIVAGHIYQGFRAGLRALQAKQMA
jgi:glycosyltransferase involved in cell wall biosynthesis